MIVHALLSLTAVIAARAIKIQSESSLAIDCDTKRDARPGTPMLAGLQAISLSKRSDDRAALGDRIVEAAKVSAAMSSCGSFDTFGDYTWCNKAMPMESEFATENRYGVHECPVHGSFVQTDSSMDLRQNATAAGFLGLSYGVFTGDPWSELMSNMYLMPTKIHDCFYKGSEGPLANDLHAGFSATHQCPGRRCYSAPYEAKRVCVGETGTQDGRKYESLSSHLQDRPPLSTFIKMDVEGGEWSQLERLLQNEEELNKIRTLDMEIHLNMDQGGTHLSGKHDDASESQALERKVKIMEQLAQKFAVTGSTLEPLFKGQARDFEKKVEQNAQYVQKEPLIYTSQGYAMPQYCISFVNRKLL